MRIQKNSNMLKLLRIACPLCIKKDVATAPEYWICGKCGAYMYIDEYANVHCLQCQRQEHITKMRFFCDSHRHLRKYASKNEIAAAICRMQNAGTEKENVTWLKHFVNHL